MHFLFVPFRNQLSCSFDVFIAWTCTCTDCKFYLEYLLLIVMLTVTVQHRHTPASACADLALQVPLACDLGQVIPQLANLRNFAGCVELPLRKAAALDPSGLASRPGPEGRQAREVCSLTFA